MNLLARIELLEEIAEDLHEDLADTRDELRSTADVLQFLTRKSSKSGDTSWADSPWTTEAPSHF